MTSTSLASRTLAAGPAALLAAVALAFLPVANLPSFDVPKLALLLVGAALLTALAWRRRATGARDGVLADPVLAIPLVLALVAAVGAVAAYPRGSLVGPATAVGCIAVARLAALAPDARAAAARIARGAAFAAAAAGAYGLLQASGADFTPWSHRREPVSTFGNASFAAEFQAAALPLCVYLAARAAAPAADRVLGSAGALLALAHLLVARSRTDYVAAAAAVGAGVCLLLLARGRRRAAAGIAAAAALAGAGFAVAFFAASRGEGPAWIGRSDTIAVRTGVWDATARMIADEPFRVAGPSFVDAFPAWRDPAEYRISLGRRVETPHQDFLEIAVALGIPGLAAALAVVAVLARRLVALAPAAGAEAAALGASLAATAVSALSSSPLSHPATALLPACAAGLVVGLAPRPLRRLALPARAADVALAAAAALAFAPGPALRGLRSDGFLALGKSEIGNDPQRALSLLDEAAAADPQAYDARYELGTLLHSARQHDAAIAALSAARAIRPGEPNCAVNLAYALRSSGRRDDAVRLVEDELRRCPWHPLLLAARAVFALESGDDALARDAAARALAGLPSDPRLAALAAEAALPRTGGDAPADPEDSDAAARETALDALGRLFAEGELDEFGRSARAMLRRDPGLLGPLATRARRLAAKEGSLASALVLAASSSARDDDGFLDEASRVLREAGREEESRTLLGRALGVRGARALARGDTARALKLGAQAAERDPSPAHFLLVARAAAGLGERDAAIDSIGAAVASGPVDPAEVRGDPALSKLLPDARLEDLLERAARRLAPR